MDTAHGPLGKGSPLGQPPRAVSHLGYGGETPLWKPGASYFNCLALLLLVLGILADDHYMTMTLDNLALFADFLYGRLYFHSILPPFLFYRAEPQTFYIHSFIMTYPLSSWYAT